MSLVVLHPRLYAILLAAEAQPHKSLKVRREIEKLRSKKREGNRIQINLEPEDAQAIAGIIHEYDLARMSGEKLRDYMEQIARTPIDASQMNNTAYVGYSSSEWKAMIEIAAGVESTLDLKEVPPVIFYDLSSMYHAVEYYLGYMVGRAYGHRSPTEADDERELLKQLDADSIAALERIEQQQNQDFATAFGAVEVEPETNEEAQ
jgi:hypothetical protein